MFPDHILTFIQILVRQGVRHFIISPGSRNAPLVLALARHPSVITHVAADERAAAYHALGMAIALNYGRNGMSRDAGEKPQPIAVVTTSGTAALNLIPGSAEALLSQLPILFLTADRPPEWIGQQDGQAVWQQGAFGQHAKASYQLPARPTHPDEAWQVARMANEAYLAATSPPYGPVHVNIPFREPFYPVPGQALTWPEQVPLWQIHQGDGSLPRSVLVPLLQAWQAAGRRAIVCGPLPYQHALRNALKALLTYAPDVLLLADVASNLHSISEQTDNAALADYGMTTLKDQPDAAPDLVLLLGGSLTSRRLRNYLRTLPPSAKVWQIQPDTSQITDSTQHLTDLLVADPATFITRLGEHAFFENRADAAAEDSLVSTWRQAMEPVRARLSEALASQLFCEAHAVRAVLEALPAGGHLHLGNSMPIRWVQWLSALHPVQAEVRIWANRGASGIDGCTATAVGYARILEAEGRPVWLLTGETGALYDRNGLWLAGDLPQNLRMIVINNAGGTIFRLIDGPAAQPELETFFENRHTLTLRRTAEDFGLTYLPAHNLAEVHQGLAHLATQPGPALLEVFCSPEAAASFLDALKGAQR